MNIQWPISIALWSCMAASVWTQPVANVKTWTFTLPHGSLQISAEKTPGDSIVLGLTPVGSIPEAPVVEHVEALRQVLREMPQFGFDPRRLAYIGTRLYAKDVIEKLAYACADSPAWQSNVRGNAGRRARLVVSLLNDVEAFGPYDEAFRPYGLQVRVTEAEKIGLMPFSHVTPRNAQDRARARLPVPADAILGLRFSRIESGVRKK